MSSPQENTSETTGSRVPAPIQKVNETLNEGTQKLNDAARNSHRQSPRAAPELGAEGKYVNRNIDKVLEQVGELVTGKREKASTPPNVLDAQ